MLLDRKRESVVVVALVGLSLIIFLMISPCASQYDDRKTIDETSARHSAQQHYKRRRRAQLPSPSYNNNNSTTNGVVELRQRLLQNYDKFSYPFEHHWAKGQRTGLPIQLTINFHRVYAVEVTESMADLIVWVRIGWYDPRLVWDPVEYQNISSMHFWVADGIGMGVSSEIWTPDLHLWNAAEPLATSLADSHAHVDSDGTVFWSRPGHLKPACKFVGLNKFPFDTLTCTIEIGSWGHSGLYLRPAKLDEEGFTKGGSQTAGEAFAEFTLDSIRCEEFVYPPFPEAPDEDWPVMLYYVKFTRAWQPYVRTYLALQILLNLIGFSTFWLPPQTGERMGLNITALLAAVANQLVVQEKLPAFGEVSWDTQFSFGSLLFTALSLLENSVVIYLHYHTGSSLVPRYVRWIVHNLERLRQKGPEPPCKLIKDKEPTNQAQQQEGTNSRPTEEADDSSVISGIVDEDVLDLIHKAVHLTRLYKRRTIVGLDADDFKNDKETENNARWQRYAIIIDDVARITYPVFFSIFLAVMFSHVEMR